MQTAVAVATDITQEVMGISAMVLLLYLLGSPFIGRVEGHGRMVDVLGYIFHEDENVDGVKGRIWLVASEWAST
jgi:hypothetical protein